MWFKQVTCDKCFTPLTSQGRHNHFFFSKIISFERVSKLEFNRRKDEFCNPSEFRYNYDSSPYAYNGYVYCYLLERLDRHNSTWFCGRDCAITVAEQINSVLFYYDELERSVAMITPQLREINSIIREKSNNPLLLLDINPNEWLDTNQNYLDLSIFGYEVVFPVLTTKHLRLVKPCSKYNEEHCRLILDKKFQEDFYGSSTVEANERIKKGLEDFLYNAEVDFGRRLQIEWFIVNSKSEYIGFIRLTCKQPAYPYKWMVEFGLIENQRQRGLMKEAVNVVLDWARQNGCNEIFAISENGNVAAHHILKETIYPTYVDNKPMVDVYGGFRPMKQFKIKLILQ